MRDVGASSVVVVVPVSRAARVALLGAWCVVAGSALVDCGGPFHAYDVQIDASFSPEAIEAITSALDEWHDRTGVSFTTTITSSPPGHMDANGIYIARSTPEAKCFDGLDMAALHVAGYTFRDLGAHVECVQFKYDDNPDERAAYLRTIVLHETGHVLGLVHSPPPSVMTPNIGDAEKHLTSQDIAQWCDESGWC